MSDYKAQFNNELMINIFTPKFGINPNNPKNKILIQELFNFGEIAA